MKTKKYVIAIAIFGGMLFTAHATDLIDLNGQTTTQIEKKNFKIPSADRTVSKKDFVIGGIIGIFIAASPYLFYLYESVPDSRSGTLFCLLIIAKVGVVPIYQCGF